MKMTEERRKELREFNEQVKIAKKRKSKEEQLAKWRSEMDKKDAERKANEFFNSLINNFGPFQDAMDIGNPTLFHSLLSPYINVGLLDPMKIIVAAEKKYYEGAPLNSVEGFIRQILGWREFIRGIYWLKMPDYKSLNFLKILANSQNYSGQVKLECSVFCLRRWKAQKNLVIRITSID